MPTIRRRSARLAGSSKNGKASALPQLSSLTEGEESSVEQPTQSLDAVMSSPPPKPTTPMAATPVKLPMSEMHPSKVHQTMTAAPSSGLKLGFVDINHDQKGWDQPSGATQETPSKTNIPSSPFTFRVARPSAGDSGLSSDAQRMMEELREEAARIKANLTVQRQKQTLEEQLEGRRIATAKGKAGRFSDVHMAEFKKMDSIENHPSVFRATPGRFMPGKSGLKRSQSKAKLDEPEAKSGLKRTQSKANLDEAESMPRMSASARALVRSQEKQRDGPDSPTKRVRQRIEDDASSSRPVSQDASAIPAPQSQNSGNDSVRSAIPRSRTLANIMTPTKASAARAQITRTPTSSLMKSPSKPNLGNLATSPSKPDIRSLAKFPGKEISGGLKKSSTTGNMSTGEGLPTNVQTPGRFDRVKSILKRQFSASKPKSSIPLAGSAPKTPGNTEKEHPAIPVTTPGRRFGFNKHVEFTPDTKQATLTQNSPSPIKSSIPRSKTMSRLPAADYPSLGTVLSAKKTFEEVSYPDLSAYGPDSEKDSESAEDSEPVALPAPPQSVPGTFTFRSDHTIRFNNTSPNGFGGSAGQASLRHIRKSMTPVVSMPGGFPNADEAAPNKENADPAFRFGIRHGLSNKKRHHAMFEDEEVKTGIAHGMSNKKRHRAKWDEEDEEDEGEKRGAKKLRKGSPSGTNSVSPLAGRLAYSSPIKKPTGLSDTPSPQKKKTGITLSRLNMLARPKIRK